ncbi:hypothetical protein AtEden1_Chr5g0149151 [Arabidopsis thaliana]
MPSTVGYLNNGDWFSRPVSVDSSPPLAGSRPELSGSHSKDVRLSSSTVAFPWWHVAGFLLRILFPLFICVFTFVCFNNLTYMGW